MTGFVTRVASTEPVEDGRRDRKPVGVDGPGRRARHERGWLPRRFRSRSPTATGTRESTPTLDLFADVAEATGQPAPQAASSPRVDSRPDVTLNVHLTDEAVTSGTGVARVEQVGPVTVDRVRSWLGHANVVVKPLIDLNNQVPVDAYEIPDRIREAVHLAIPVRLLPLRHLHPQVRRLTHPHGSSAVGSDQAGGTRPDVTLYVHLTDQALVVTGQGVARVEGIGPVTVDRVRTWLGTRQRDS